MTKELIEDDFVFIPIEVGTTPPVGIIEHIKDRWWATHPEKGLAFYNPKMRNGRRRRLYGSAQCNSHESITRRLVSHKPFPVEVKFIPSVFVRVDIAEYM